MTIEGRLFHIRTVAGKKAVSEGINRSNWNAVSAAMSSRALRVWSKVD